MTPSQIVAALIVGVLLISIVGAARRMRLWHRGRSAKVAIAGGLLALPKRYLVDLHDVVARDPYIARIHIATAGGFVVLLVLLLCTAVFDVEAIWIRGLLTLSAFVVLVGVLGVALRRWRHRPQRLSAGRWNWLPASLAALAVAVVLIGVGVAQTNVAALILVSVLLLWGLGETVVGSSWGGPMKHAFAGALHLAFHPRPQRFAANELDTGLKAEDLNAAKLGVETPGDFPWNRLLGFDACVECGRCEIVCPAFAAEQPLNPKKLIQDLVVGLAGPGSDLTYRGNGHPGRIAGDAHGAPQQPIVPALIHADTLWSCTTCRACVYECPMMIEHVDAIVDMRRFLTMEQGQTAGQGAVVLEALRCTDNPGGFASNSRMDWAADQRLLLMADQGAADILLWVGDGAFDLRNQRTLKAVVKLLRKAKVDFAVLGEEELDVGDLARRLGDEATFQNLAQRNIAVLSNYKFNRIVTVDPHVLHCLKNEYPYHGGRYQVAHHTTFLADLIRAGRLTIEHQLGTSITYHDPCYLGRYNGEIDAPRFLLQCAGANAFEMERSGMRSRCCGGGGGAPFTDIPGKRRIPDLRMDDARATGADAVAVACPNCAVMLEGVVQPRPEVKDVAEVLAEAVGV